MYQSWNHIKPWKNQAYKQSITSVNMQNLVKYDFSDFYTFLNNSSCLLQLQKAGA